MSININIIITRNTNIILRKIWKLTNWNRKGNIMKQSFEDKNTINHINKKISKVRFGNKKIYSVKSDNNYKDSKGQ